MPPAAPYEVMALTVDEWQAVIQKCFAGIAEADKGTALIEKYGLM